MSRNNARLSIRSWGQRWGRSLGVWLCLALAVGLWTSRLAGQNAPPTYQSPNVVSESPKKSSPLKLDRSRAPNLDMWKSPRRSAAPAPSITSTNAKKSTATSGNSVPRSSGVVPASHEQLSTSPVNPPIGPDLPPGAVPDPLPPSMLQARPATPGPSFLFPTERTVPPQITGRHLGLQPGETATERSLRLMTVIAELEQTTADLTEQNARLKEELKAKDAKLQSATSQIAAARKELLAAQDEFQRLRKEITTLRDKHRVAEEENASLMRSLSPLLKQLLGDEGEASNKD